MLSYRGSGLTPGPAALDCCVVSWVFECSGLIFGTCLAQPSLKVGQFEPVVSWYNAMKSRVPSVQVGCRAVHEADKDGTGCVTLREPGTVPGPGEDRASLPSTQWFYGPVAVFHREINLDYSLLLL